MAFDAFLEFPKGALGGPTPVKVVGESKDAAHPNTVQVMSFTFGVENPTTIGSASAGAGAGKAKFNALQVTKTVDAASPSLFMAVGSGVHFPEAVLYVRKSGTGTDYLTYRFAMVFVTKVDWSGTNGDDQMGETVQFVYGAMKVSYAAQQPNGQLSGTPAVSSWSQVTNSSDYTVPTS